MGHGSRDEINSSMLTEISGSRRTSIIEAVAGKNIFFRDIVFVIVTELHADDDVV